MATERPVASMRLQMPRESLLYGEGLGAQVAGITPFSRVDAVVCLQVVFVRKRLGAKLAGVRPFPRVDTGVPGEVGLVGKLLLADGARKRLLARVRALMHPEVACAGERLAAHFAGMPLLPGVNASVAVFTGECSRANLTMPRPVSRMHVYVRGKIFLGCKRMRAQVALVRLLHRWRGVDCEEVRVQAGFMRKPL